MTSGVGDPDTRPLPDGSVPIKLLHDRVLFEPEDRGSVELQGVEYLLLRERDIHAVATGGDGMTHTGLYL